MAWALAGGLPSGLSAGSDAGLCDGPIASDLPDFLSLCGAEVGLSACVGAAVVVMRGQFLN